MAINLNPGADATLVGAAYRAAMANAPKDYSGTLERAADSYEKTMEASGEMWNNVAKIGAKLGGEMVKNANERAAYAAKTNALNPEDAKFLMDGIYKNKDAQKELGLLPGIFGSRETKRRLAELKMEQQDIFAEIDLAAASIKTGTDAVAAGTFDTKLAMNDGEMVNAIIKSGLKNRVTDNGNIAKLGRDEYGELAYTLYKESGGLADNPNGTNEPVTMSIKQFNEAIATNVDDKGAMALGWNAYNNEVVTSRGFKSRTGVYDEQMRAVDSNWIDTQLGDKPVNLKRAMHMKFGYSDTSFFDDITKNKNEYSAALYADLLKATGGGDVLTGVITDGMKDTDGVEGISAQEAMNSENYKVLTANLLGMKDPEVTKALFKDYTLKEFEKANNYGHGNKAPKPGTVNKTDGGENTYSLPKKIRIGKTIDGRYQNNMDDYAAEDLLNDVAAGDSFEFEEMNYSYVFDKDGGAWHRWGLTDAEQTPTEDTKVGSAADLETYVFKTRHPAFKNMVTEKEEGQTIDKSGQVSTTPSKSLETSFTDFQQNEYDFTENINTKYDLSDYIVKDAKGQTFPFKQLGIESFANAIEIFDKRGNKLASFRTNYTDEKKAQNAAEQFNKFLASKNIKLKDPTAGMDNKQLIEYYKNNPGG